MLTLEMQAQTQYDIHTTTHPPVVKHEVASEPALFRGKWENEFLAAQRKGRMGPRDGGKSLPATHCSPRPSIEKTMQRFDWFRLTDDKSSPAELIFATCRIFNFKQRVSDFTNL